MTREVFTDYLHPVRDKNVIISNIMSMKLNDKVTAAIIEYLLR